MKFETKYKLVPWKTYFETGWSFTAVIRYLIVLLGIAEGFATQALTKTFIIAFFGCSFSSLYSAFPFWIICGIGARAAETVIAAYSGETVHLFRRIPSTRSKDKRPPVSKGTIQLVGA